MVVAPGLGFVGFYRLRIVEVGCLGIFEFFGC